MATTPNISTNPPPPLMYQHSPYPYAPSVPVYPSVAQPAMFPAASPYPQRTPMPIYATDYAASAPRTHTHHRHHSAQPVIYTPSHQSHASSHSHGSSRLHGTHDAPRRRRHSDARHHTPPASGHSHRSHSHSRHSPSHSHRLNPTQHAHRSRSHSISHAHAPAVVVDPAYRHGHTLHRRSSEPASIGDRLRRLFGIAPHHHGHIEYRDRRTGQQVDHKGRPIYRV